MIPDRKLSLKCAKLSVKEWIENKPVGVDVVPAQGIPLPGIAFVTAKKWKPGRTIRIAFMDGSDGQKTMVRKAGSQWLEHANLQFEFDAAVSTAEVRVSFSKPGAWSFIGTDCLGIPKNQPTMNFGFISEGTVLHEFGHMLGCIHEHQHPEAGIPWDEPKVYAYYKGPPNNWDQATVRTNLFEKYGKDITQFSAYDTKSIMHYAVDGALLKDPSKAVGWNDVLSPSDIDYVKKIYPRGDVKPVSPPVVPVTLTLPESGTYKLVDFQGKKAILFN